MNEKSNSVIKQNSLFPPMSLSSSVIWGKSLGPLCLSFLIYKMSVVTANSECPLEHEVKLHETMHIEQHNI